MNEPPDPQLLFLQDLLAENATIAGDVVEIGANTWAIHGSILVDGDVILAEYDTRDQAARVVGQLSAASPERPLPDVPAASVQAVEPPAGFTGASWVAL